MDKLWKNFNIKTRQVIEEHTGLCPFGIQSQSDTEAPKTCFFIYRNEQDLIKISRR